MNTSRQIGSYLIERLYDLGVRHVFGVPGDFVLKFNQQLEAGPLMFVNTCDEQGAGFAADAYARLRGLGVVCVTYCVGGLKIANPIAQAYAEKSPVIVISGAPGTHERLKNPMLHHKVRDFDTQLKVFEQLTVATAVLDQPDTALQDIDRVLAAVQRYKRPGYLELPRDRVMQMGNLAHQPAIFQETSDANALQEALAEAVSLINQAQRPVILAGVEIHRFGLQTSLHQLAEKTGIPVATTLLGKSVFNEQYPGHLGVYEGAMGHESVRQAVENSDCLLMLGTFLSDINLGIYTAHLDPKHSIYVTSEKTTIQFHHYEDITLADFLTGLIAADIRPRSPIVPDRTTESPIFLPVVGQPLTVERLFARLNTFIDDQTIVIADVGDALFGGADLRIPTDFLAPAYYASLGFAVPASLGAQLAAPHLRPLVLVGDGAFQMTGMELSTIVRYGLNPIVIVLNNKGYGTERPMQDGRFNDILPWHYSRLPDLLGQGHGFVVRTEDDLEAALVKSRKYTDHFCLLDVQLDPWDSSPALKRLTRALAERVQHQPE